MLLSYPPSLSININSIFFFSHFCFTETASDFDDLEKKPTNIIVSLDSGSKTLTLYCDVSNYTIVVLNTTVKPVVSWWAHIDGENVEISYENSIKFRKLIIIGRS